MTDLIQRLTDATGNERGLFAEAFEAVQPGIDRPDWLAYAARFYAMLDAEAWTSAAEMLVGDGVWVTVDPHFMDEEGVVRFKPYTFRPDWSRWVPCGHGIEWLNRWEGPLCHTEANARTIAALKAHGGNDAE